VDASLPTLLVNGLMYFAGVGIIGLYIRGIKDQFKDEVKELKDTDKELRKDLDHHGHRGLDSEGCQVVRT